MSVPREYYFDGCDDGFLDDRGGNMINPRVGHPLYLQAGTAANNEKKTRLDRHMKDSLIATLYYRSKQSKAQQ